MADTAVTEAPARPQVDMKTPDLSPVRRRGTEHVWDAPGVEATISIAKRAAHFHVYEQGGHTLAIRRNGAYPASIARIYCDEEQLRELHADLTAYFTALEAAKATAEQPTTHKGN